MGATAEVRWFFRGQAPAPVVSWFADLGAEAQERADHYLRLPETDALGVKLRGGAGSLELKLREHELGEQDLSGGIAGNVELWRKWSVDLGPGGPGTESLIVVHKVRRLVTYAPPGWKPSLEPAEGGGCNVEITDLQAQEEKWSTLGMEAFGSEDTILGSLHSACRAFFGELDLPQALGADLSSGYPGWLRHLLRSSGA